MVKASTHSELSESCSCIVLVQFFDRAYLDRIFYRKSLLKLDELDIRYENIEIVFFHLFNRQIEVKFNYLCISKGFPTIYKPLLSKIKICDK